MSEWWGLPLPEPPPHQTHPLLLVHSWATQTARVVGLSNPSALDSGGSQSM